MDAYLKDTVTIYFLKDKGKIADLPFAFHRLFKNYSYHQDMCIYMQLRLYIKNIKNNSYMKGK